MRVRVLLDSTFVIDYLRGDPAALRRWRDLFEAGVEPMLNDVVVCEVRAGLRTQDEHRFAALVEPTEFIQPGPESALQAGIWRRQARERGATLALGDALIAAAAHAVGAAVLTRNLRDFTVTPVSVETY